jgi:catechol 2,3-dioxygenase-like lactoylglutathione lyase family enzyme
MVTEPSFAKLGVRDRVQVVVLAYETGLVVPGADSLVEPSHTWCSAVRLNQVTLAVSDLDRSVDFYRNLGLKQIVADESYARFACPDGDSTLSLEQLQTVPPSATTVYLECEDLDATVSRLEVAGLGFEHPPIDQPWLWREARLRDPDGNPLCLFRGGENRLNPPRRLPS